MGTGSAKGESVKGPVHLGNEKNLRGMERIYGQTKVKLRRWVCNEMIRFPKAHLCSTHRQVSNIEDNYLKYSGEDSRDKDRTKTGE